MTRQKDKLLTGNVWKQFKALTKGSKPLRVAVAYVTSDRFLKLSKGDVLICDASKAAIETGQTSAKLLAGAFERGVLVYSHPRLHAKLAVSGRHVLIGSANLSASSEEALTELSLLTEQSDVMASCIAFIEDLKEASQEVDEAFLSRLLQTEVKRRPKALGPRKKVIAISGSRLWIVQSETISSRLHNKEIAHVEEAEEIVKPELKNPQSEIDYLRWSGKSRFRSQAKRGDRIIEVRKIGSSNRHQIREPRVILYKQDAEQWTRFYYELPSPPSSISWSQFQSLLTDSHLKGVKREKISRLSEADSELLAEVLLSALKRLKRE